MEKLGIIILDRSRRCLSSTFRYTFVIACVVSACSSNSDADPSSAQIKSEGSIQVTTSVANEDASGVENRVLSEVFYYPFEDASVSEYQSAISAAAYSINASGLKLIEAVAGAESGQVAEPGLFPVFDYKAPVDSGMYVGQNLVDGVLSKITRWFDFEIDSGAVYMSVVLVDFDTYQHAIDGASIQGKIETIEGSKSQEIWNESKSENFLLRVNNERSMIFAVSCAQTGTLPEKERCTRESMRILLNEIMRRSPSGEEPAPIGKTVELVSIPNGLKPIATYTIDADVNLRISDPRGELRKVLDSKSSIDGDYQFSGQTMAFSLGAKNPDALELYLAVDIIPIIDGETALQFTKTVCETMGSVDNSCRETEIVRSGSKNLLGGRTAITYWTPLLKNVNVVLAHMATEKYFLNFACGFAVFSDLSPTGGVDTPGESEINSCYDAILAISKNTSG